MEQITEKALDKVKLLLERANGRGTTEEEANTAMLLAQKLLTKHGLSMDDVNIEEEKKEVIDEDVTDYTKTPWWHLTLGTTIAKNFRCKCIKRTTDGYSKLLFIGLKEDVAIAKQVFMYALKTIDYLASKYIRKARAEGKSTAGLRNVYVSGFLRGLGERFEEQVEKEGWGLVLVLDPVVQERLSKLKLTNTRGSKARLQRNPEAFTDGYMQGKNFDHGRKQID